MKNIIYLNVICNIHSKNRNKFASFLIHRKDAINDISTNQQKQSKNKSKLYDVILNQYAIIQFLYYLLHKLVRGLTKLVRGLTKNSKRTY